MKFKHRHPTHLPPYCAPPVTIVMAADGTLPPPERFAILRRPWRHIREQLISLTSWGIHPAHGDAADVVRKHLSDDAGRGLGYLETGHSRAQRVIFIHGSPGRGDEWGSYLENCPDDQNRIAVDRAGYGESQPANAPQTLATQAHAIAPLLRQGSILVGYSYGGPIALTLGLHYPELVAGILLIGCPIDPQIEHVHPLQKLAATPLMARFLPKGLHASNIELLTFKPDLEDLVPKLGDVGARLTLMQGLRDTLVPPSNAEMLARHLTRTASPRSILVPDGDHYLPWTHQTTIEQAITFVQRDCSLPHAAPDAT